MKCIFEQFLSATTIPSVALVSAPSTMPSCFLKTYTYKQSYIYKPQLSTLVWEKQCWPSPAPPTIYPPKKPSCQKYCAILTEFKIWLFNKCYWLNP